MPEDSKVATATKAVRDLAVPFFDFLRPAFGSVGGVLQLLGQLAGTSLRNMPRAASRVGPLLLAVADGARQIPRDRKLAPNPTVALQALAGYAGTDDDELRPLYVNLLLASMDRVKAPSLHPAFPQMLRQITGDEARIMALFRDRPTYPVISVLARQKRGGNSQLELRNWSQLGDEARCRAPERAPTYIDNLCRLSLTELRPARPTDDTRGFRELEQHPRVAALCADILSRPALQFGSVVDPIVPELQQKFLSVTTLGRAFAHVLAD